MSMQTMKIYTKTGDKGETSLFGGKRVKKNSLRVQAYGNVDELNSYIGLCLAYIQEKEGLIASSHKKKIFLEALLTHIQGKLFCIGSLTAREGNAPLTIGEKMIQITSGDIEELERSIDAMDKHLAQLNNFILPDGSVIVCHIHVARTIARRCERNLVALEMEDALADNIVPYINRLSDLLFTLARYINILEEGKETKWVY